MKNIKYVQYLIVVLTLVILQGCGNKKPSATEISENAETSDSIVPTTESAKETVDSTYYYHNPDDSYDYDVIELISKGGEVYSGYFWGTDRDFWDNVEPCLPGFIVLPMQDIEQQGDTLNFVLDSNRHEFYSAPVSIYIHDPEKEQCDTLRKWYVPSSNCWDTVKFTAVFNKKELSIIAKSKYWYWDDKPHVFHAYDIDSLAKILPPIPEDIEKINHGDGWFPVLNDTVSTEEITEEIPFDS